LKRSEQLSEGNYKCLNIVYNNIGCYYRSLGNFGQAMIYLEKAMKLESKVEDTNFKANTHLTVCTVLSQLGKHDLAMSHAQTAIIII